jgi:pimeloyl-ACP methyl ester carboxylesterase
MRRLVVIATGINVRSKQWQPLLMQLLQEQEFADSEWLVYSHYGWWSVRTASKFFTQSLETVALDLKAKIELAWIAAMENGKPYDDVILIGHSLGGLLIRQAYLVAAGAYPKTLESEINWVKKVSRFVLFASLNNGLESNNFLLPIVNISSTTGWLSIIRDTVQGSDFITNLRISWIRYFANRSEPEPVMIQILGTSDDTVKRTDSIDLQSFPNGVQLDIPDANHQDLYYPKGKSVEALAEWSLRYQLLKWAIVDYNPQNLNLVPDELQGTVNVDPGRRATQTTTVFIVHGIRDGNSGWATELKRQIELRTNKNVEVVCSTYGYFSAFNFFFPWLRKQNIRWFQNEYSYRFARNPKAAFHFIGHSNGTYILGESLKRVPAMQFERVYLAGSVLPREYPWNNCFDLNQISSLRNDRSCQDWPVGILCSGLHGIGMNDIGTGGFDGFDVDDIRKKEFFFHNGGHGKPLEQANHGSILNFTLDGNISQPDNLLKLEQTSPKFQFISRVSPQIAQILFWIVLPIIFIAWLWWMSHDFAWNSPKFWSEFAVSIGLVSAGYILAKTG